jgi:hypothetical protein
MKALTTPKSSASAVKDRYLTIRVPPEVELALRRQADADTRTLAAQVLHYIKQGLAKSQEEAAA